MSLNSTRFYFCVFLFFLQHDKVPLSYSKYQAVQASSLQTLGAVILQHPVMWVTLSCFDRCWTADTLVDELAIFLQDCPLSGVKTKTEKAGKMGTFVATRSVSSASTHLHHCHISWSQGCEVIQTSGPSAMFSKVPPDKPDLSLTVNAPQHVNGLLPVGPTPSAAVSTVTRKGQRGDF
ncbi:uncharacterized protein LOC102291469 [Haplochromis burtoni]|uniref:uncharacterized protein LOC102291469 n=1 Tax=Haplochromis burtoni TaxID=8153 RepID=UPI001C2D1C24|nr:uncharacterized protein LOC102291469 [Haplochromis burtoni]